MNTDEMKRIAEIVYPHLKWELLIDMVIGFKPDRRYDTTEFCPSMNGSDEQARQALDVIVAAFNLRPGASLDSHDGGYRFVYEDHEAETFWPCPSGDDLLQAASAALLSQEGR